MRATHADSTHAEGKKHHEHIPVTTCTCTCCHCQIFHRQMVGMERRATSATAEAAAAIAALLAAIAAAAVPHSNSPHHTSDCIPGMSIKCPVALSSRNRLSYSFNRIYSARCTGEFILIQQNIQHTLHRKMLVHCRGEYWLSYSFNRIYGVHLTREYKA